MSDIFISYARADREQIEKLATQLVQCGYSVWWDRELTGGGEFSKEIESEISSAKAVIVAWSEHGVESPWVRDEASLARQMQKLFPIRLDEAGPPLGFQQYHTFDFSCWAGNANEEVFISLRKSLKKRIGLDDTYESITAEPTTFRSRRITLAPIIIAAVVLLLAGLTGFFLLRPPIQEAAQEAPISDNGLKVAEDGMEATQSVGLGVIPFVNMSSDPEQEYFADGLSEELLNWLANVEGLNVPGRTASFQFKDKTADFSEIGQRLGVEYILEGSIRRAGNNIRITAQLIEAETGFHLWSETYDRKFNDLFAIQDEVSQRVVTELLGKIPETGAKNPANVGNVDPESHQLYLEGRGWLLKRNWPKAFGLFSEAATRDPNHWLAQAYLAVAGAQAHFHGMDPTNGTQSLSELVNNSLKKAIAIRPDAADVIFAKAWVLEFMRQVRTGSQQTLDHEILDLYREAIRANPRHVVALHALARSEPDANLRLEYYKKVIDIEPGHYAANVNVANYYIKKGEFDKATSYLQRFNTITSEANNVMLADVYKQMGDWRNFFDVIIKNWKTEDAANIERRRRATALAEFGELSAAANYYQLISGNNSTDPFSLWVLSSADLLIGDVASAIKRLELGLENANHPDWYPRAYAYLLLYHGDAQAAWNLISENYPYITDIQSTEDLVFDDYRIGDPRALIAALALNRLGRRESSEKILRAHLPIFEEQYNKQWSGNIGRAIIFANIGEHEKAFVELESAFENGFRYPYSFFCVGCISLDFYTPNGFFGDIYNDPRFAVYVSKIEQANAEAYEEFVAKYNLTERIAKINAEVEDLEN